MKKIIFLSAIIISQTLMAQNVGVGTTNPQATLDVRGNQRLGGAIHFTSFDSVGGKIEWKNANLYIPVSQYLMQHSAAADGLFYNNNAPISGQLEYRNALGNPVFYTNFTNGNGYFSNNLGIRNSSPAYPLSLNGALGDKISLWTDGSSTHYGFGVQPGLLQIFSKTINDDVAFGFGASTSFTERMRIKGNGLVGIGTSSPQATLHIAGSLKTNSLNITNGGTQSDFLVKSNASGDVGFRKGHTGLGLSYIICIQGIFPSQQGSGTNDIAFLGEVKLFAGNYPPNNWAFCNGQLLPIITNQLLFALLGTTYGGNGVNNFQLPDLRDAVPVGAGASWFLGEKSN